MRAPVPARLLLLALLCLAAAACGGSGDDSPSAAPATTAASGTTAAASPACADAAALKASIAELDQLDPPQAGKAGTVAALQEVRDDLTKLKASAGSEWGDQVTELDAAVNAFQATISGISGDSLLSDLPTIVSDLERIDTAWKALDEQITETCPTGG
ncbi:MAG TPA: hypothetical protein VF468_20255 [Actinomycetota bacterium]|jgi:hypothetical protein|nr:hypothetical protein [Actinomycetota bacterium]